MFSADNLQPLCGQRSFNQTSNRFSNTLPHCQINPLETTSVAELMDCLMCLFSCIISASDSAYMYHTSKARSHFSSLRSNFSSLRSYIARSHFLTHRSHFQSQKSSLLIYMYLSLNSMYYNGLLYCTYAPASTVRNFVVGRDATPTI